ncbi:hypothetical protein BU16DRAFT_536981 [Lophium mytilinum]|uniref:Uncharacterized protein n=1 Tax=Lophium mytilinum TaxID=390894 RepID=A0A6A6QXW8_9PEZI|nr:hypothetical protein BU16DRAFT_536981 [Lophium mytilinum]
MSYFDILVEEGYTVLVENLTNPLTWSLLLKPDTILVTRRIRKYVLNGDTTEAWRLKESYKDTFAMEAIAAAIIAQIAITMPGLADFGNIHWTATAFAYTSLVSGLLSTFFSFYVQQILSDLHRPEDVQEWLTSPRKTPLDRLLSKISARHRRWQEAQAAKSENAVDRIPSITAAAALTAPSRLLAFSIVTLFVALGVYLGSVYTANLGTLKGPNGNLAVLLFFIVFTTWAIVEVFLPLNTKQVEQIAGLPNLSGRPSTGIRSNQVDAETSAATANSGGTSDTDAVIRRALEASIHAQEESLKAQKALLRLLL